MDNGEAVGKGAPGAAVSVGADGHSDERSCLNCAAPLVGPYCHCCGQHGHVHRTLSAFFHDLLHSVFHFEGRLWRTLPLLAWRPGELTRRYIDGQRARFVSPMALFLFSVFLMFAVLGLSDAGELAAPDTPAERARVEAKEADERAAARRKIADLERRVAAARARGLPTQDSEARLTDLRVELEVEERTRAAARLLAEGRSAEGATKPGFNLIAPTGWAWLDRAVAKAEANPSLLFYKLRTNAYKWSWVLIPLSVPFLWLLFPFSRRFRLYDHMVFVTYSLSFMTMLVIVAILASAAGVPGVAALASLVPPIHMFLQLRGAYALTRLGALWRTVLLTLFAFNAVVMFVMMIVGVGLID